MRKTSMLKNLILDEEILVMPGAYDALSARIIELVGFKAVMLGGYSATASRLGKPDVSLLGLKEMADCLHYIVEAVDLPVFADGDKMILFDDFNKIVGLDKIRAAEAHYLQDIFESLQPQHK
jgi:2-methylisocitrate lyase-like PEP mutase family enzyme